ncbi:(Fe-S)-binding protein [bacterium]|nr:(Fe-S)-binding protein [bacterium]
MDKSEGEILSEIQKCVKCGLCQSVCPLYKDLVQEIFVARGRLSLMENNLEKFPDSPHEGGKSDTPDNRYEVSRDFSLKFRETIDKCMVCLQCQHNCPQGIDYEGLILYFRHKIHEQFGYNPAKRFLLRDILSEEKYKSILSKTSSTLFRILSSIKVSGDKVSSKEMFPFTRFPFPKFPQKSLHTLYPEELKAAEEKFRVGFFIGCAIDYMMTDMGKALLELCSKLNTTVIMPKRQTCCGLPAKIFGDFNSSNKMMNENVEVFKDKNLDYIVTLCASCGKELKNNEYFADKVLDFTELFLRIINHRYNDDGGKVLKNDKGGKLKVTYHFPCHLRCGQGIIKEPLKILKSLRGVDFLEMEDAETCCGLAGTFGVNEREISKRIGKKKAEKIAASGADVLVTSCPACIFQISYSLKGIGSDIKAIHIVELLNMLA